MQLNVIEHRLTGCRHVRGDFFEEALLWLRGKWWRWGREAGESVGIEGIRLRKRTVWRRHVHLGSIVVRCLNRNEMRGRNGILPWRDGFDRFRCFEKEVLQGRRSSEFFLLLIIMVIVCRSRARSRRTSSRRRRSSTGMTTMVMIHVMSIGIIRVRRSRRINAMSIVSRRRFTMIVIRWNRQSSTGRFSLWPNCSRQDSVQYCFRLFILFRSRCRRRASYARWFLEEGCGCGCEDNTTLGSFIQMRRSLARRFLDGKDHGYACFVESECLLNT